MSFPLVVLPPRRVRGRIVLGGVGLVLSAAIGLVIASDVFGKNEHEVLPGRVYRSAQLALDDLDRLIAQRHIACVLSLRKDDPPSPELAEETKHLELLGIVHQNIPMSPTKLPKPETIAALIARFDAGPYPMLVHCEEGADRTGLAAAVWLVLNGKKSIADARASELSLRTGHVSWGQAHAMDDFFDMYARTARGLNLREWMLEAYPTLYDGRARVRGTSDVLAHEPH